MNPSFRPPPPISDAQRETMYVEYMKDPEANSVRVLSQRYNLSIKRVDAILRLKGLERAWRKVCWFCLFFLCDESKSISLYDLALTWLDSNFIYSSDLRFYLSHHTNLSLFRYNPAAVYRLAETDHTLNRFFLYRM